MGQIAHALLTRPPLELKPSSRSLPILIPARLACVKHAASVRPEPGSNSDVQSLSCFAVYLIQLAKASRVSPQIKRLLSQKSDCSCILDLLFAVSFSRIVAVVSTSLCAVLATTLMIIANPFVLVKRFFQLFCSLTNIYVFLSH